MTPRFPPDFLDLLTELSAADARFLLVGGHAVAFYGRPRATKDFDLFIEASPENARKVMHALRSFGAPIGSLSEGDLSRPGHGFRMGTPPFRIELLTEISGLTFGEAWPNRQRWNVGPVELAVIGRQDLIRNKRAAGRPQDLADADVLERQSSRE
ncbi:MAG: nucleotidyltransferase [Polyangiaceae bacterium]